MVDLLSLYDIVIEVINQQKREQQINYNRNNK